MKVTVMSKEELQDMISIRERWLMIQAYQAGYSRGHNDTVESVYSFDCATGSEYVDEWLSKMAADAAIVADVLDKDAPKVDKPAEAG